MRASSSSIAIVASLLSAPAMAQSANDFQLPPAPTPTSTPTVEGPVDDSGIIPVGPRARPTAAPTAAATRTPSPAPTATLPSVLTPTPTPTGSPSRSPNPQSTSQPVVQQTRPNIGTGTAAPNTRRNPGRANSAAPTTRRTPQPLPGRTLAPLDEPVAPSNPSAVPAQGDAAPTATAPESQIAAPSAGAAEGSETATASAMPDWVIWAAGGAAALLALILGLAWRRRKQHAVPAELMAAPVTETIAEPDSASTEAVPIIATPADLSLKLEIEQLSRSMMMMTLKCRVTIANRTDRAARDVSIAADLVSANRSLPIEAQVATATAFLPEIGEASRIGPHKTQSLPATITLPIQQLAAFKHGNKPMFVPLVRVRMDTKDAEPEFHTFVVGIAADPTLTASTKLHPVPLDGIPGSYDNVRARRLDNPA